MKEFKQVSVIIPTLNEAPTIGGLVRSLVANSYPNKEIIVVDDGSSDGTPSIARGEGAMIVRGQKERGPANMKNLGANVSRGEVLCFLDGDMKKVNPNFLSKAMMHFEDPKTIGARTSRKLPRGSPWVEKWHRTVRSSPLTKFFGKKIAKGTSFTFIRKEVFAALGGYPRIGWGEDVMLAAKTKKYLDTHRQAKIVFEPSSIVYDGAPHSVGEFFRQFVWYGRTVIPFLRKAELGIVSKTFILARPLGYLLSILSIPLLLVSPWFLILAFPYIAKLIFIIYESVKNRDKFRLLTPMMDFIEGIGRFIGLVQYLCGHKSLSRGGKMKWSTRRK